jgi:CelD/BcsL family acetyltransferase involved in cellulose biosynthesis
MSGELEQVATVLTDPCLADCIEALGDHSDNPSEAELAEVTPGLIERHGLATVRLTLAASVAGEAAASVLLTRLLKHDDVLALPAREEAAPAVVLVNEADDDTKARRKAAKERKQAEAKLKRDQQARARNRL